MYSDCRLCPRKCRVNRQAGQLGFCGASHQALIAKTMLHPWEEPVLSPEGKSGAVFFGGCTLKCSYCQNRTISQRPTGIAVDSRELRQMMEALIDQGAENIDLVTPTHYLPTLLPALEEKLRVPVIYNCGGYESVESLKLLQGKVDVYLPDFKYAHSGLAARLSGASDYFPVAGAAIKEMVKQTGKPRFQGEQMVSGTLIRHLVLPGNVENSLRVLDWIGENFAPGEVLVSLMRQYTPVGQLPSPLNRQVTQEEYEAVLSWMYLNGLQGFVQEDTAAQACFIPDF